MRLLFPFLVLAAAAFGQPLNPVRFVATDPTGACSALYITQNTATGNLSGCVNGTWASLGGASGPVGPAGGVLSGTYPNPAFALPNLPLGPLVLNSSGNAVIGSIGTNLLRTTIAPGSGITIQGNFPTSDPGSYFQILRDAGYTWPLALEMNGNGNLYSNGSIWLCGTSDACTVSAFINQATDPTMGGVWGDVDGPAWGTRPPNATDGSGRWLGRNFVFLDGPGNQVLNVENNGALSWGHGIYTSMDAILLRNAAGQLCQTYRSMSNTGPVLGSQYVCNTVTAGGASIKLVGNSGQGPDLLDIRNESGSLIKISPAGSITFGASAVDMGFGNNTAIFGTSGQPVRVNSTGVALSTGTQLTSSATAHAYDATSVALQFSSAGVWEINNGTFGTYAGLKLATEVLTGTAPTVAAGQVGLGATTAVVANCGGLATGCLVINVAGTTRYIPYF